MSDPYPPSHTRIFLNVPPFLRRGGCSLGCAGIVFAIFALGGVLGLLIFGWRVLLGYQA